MADFLFSVIYLKREFSAYIALDVHSLLFVLSAKNSDLNKR